MAATPERVPVTILTGSLGAGKTTLLRRILTEKHGLRIAVIENELADSMGIESLILKQEVGGKVADGFFELSNGCLCCTQRDGLVDTLQRLMRLRDRFDRILVETSGAADPGPVASTFWTDLGEDDALLTLDGIVTVVDAVNFERDLLRPREAGAMNETERQVAFADLILVNKIDLLRSPEVEDRVADAPPAKSRVAQLTDRLRAINAAATIMPCVRGEVPLEQLLGLHAYQTADADGAAAVAGDVVAAGSGSAAASSHVHAADGWVLGPLHGIENAAAAAVPSPAAAADVVAGGSPLHAYADAARPHVAESAHAHRHDGTCSAACAAAHVHDSRIGSWVWHQTALEPLKPELRPSSSAASGAAAASDTYLDAASHLHPPGHLHSPVQGQRTVLDYDAFRQWLGVLVWESRIPFPEDVGAASAADASGASAASEASLRSAADASGASAASEASLRSAAAADASGASAASEASLRSAAAAELAALGPPPPVKVLRTKGAVWLAADTAPADEVAACSLRASGLDGRGSSEREAADAGEGPDSAAPGSGVGAAVPSASSGASACFLLQGVHDLFEVTPLRTGGHDAAALPPIAAAGAIVFIGEGVVQAAPWLRASLLACAVLRTT